MNSQEILAALRAKKLISASELDVQCDNINTISYRDILELYLLVSGIKHYRWVDCKKNFSRRQPMIRILGNIVRDVLIWPVVYLDHLDAIDKIQKQIFTRKAIVDGRTVLFLRTDHWFNVISGGSVGHLSGVIRAFRSLGCQAYVVSTDYLMGLEEDVDFYLCAPVYEIGRNLPNMPELLYNTQLVRLIDKRWKEWLPSFIYQRYSLGNYSGVLLKQKYGVPYICEYNGSFVWVARHWGGRKLFHEKLMTRIELLNLRAADLVVVVSQPIKDELIVREIDPAKILVNPNGVEPEQYSPKVDGSEIRCQYNLDGETVIGFIGTFGPWHGAEMLALAAAMLCRDENQANLHFLFIGDGMRRAVTEQLAQEAGISQYCSFTGIIPQHTGPTYLAACDILVSPHVPNPDGTPFFGSPTKLFEYMAMGKGIVASDLGQIGEVLKDGETAILVRPGDPDDLARGILHLVEHPEAAARLGQNARRVVLERYTWKQHVGRLLHALEQVQQDGKIRGD